mmetsp:Transcript_39051/g.125543  ORF Transcript_39051/g.125543 Transcript_39051/m.125543 type:complete len:524 (-) Transcript_39051:218-1789(-)
MQRVRFGRTQCRARRTSPPGRSPAAVSRRGAAAAWSRRDCAGLGRARRRGGGSGERRGWPSSPRTCARTPPAPFLELVALARLALPIGIVQLGMVAMGTVDTVMVGRVSADALASVALGNWWKLFWVVLGQGFLMALDGMVSKAAGAGDDDGVGAALVNGLVLSVAYSVILSPMLLVCGPCLRALGQPASLLPLASDYSIVQILAVLPTLAFVVLRQTFQAIGMLRPVIFSVLVANLVNVFLNFSLIWGMPRLGIPALGPLGSGWATVLCSWLMLAALAGAGRNVLMPLLNRPKAPRSAVFRNLASLVRLGVPVGLHQVTEFAAFATMMLLVGQFGVVQVAAHQVAMSIASISWNVSLGLSAAAAVRAGQAVGRRDPAGLRRACLVSAALGAIIMGGASVLLFAMPSRLASWFTSDQAVIAQAASLLPIAGLFQVFDGAQTISAGVLRGMLDTGMLFWAAMFGYWAVGTPISFLLSRVLGLGAPGVWWGMVGGLFVASSLLQFRVLHCMRRANQICGVSDDKV